MDQPLRVLFVDDHDATRARMAAGILRAQGGEDFEVASAGTAPRAVEPRTRELLRSFDMDPGAGLGTPVQHYVDEAFDYIIVLRDVARDEPIPQLDFGPSPVEWDIPEPADAADDARQEPVRRVFELLRQRIQVFVLAQHDELRARGSDRVIGAHQPTDLPATEEEDASTRRVGPADDDARREAAEG